MGWLIVAAIVIALAVPVWRYERRMRRSDPDHRAIRTNQMRARVSGNMGSGKDVKYRG